MSNRTMKAMRVAECGGPEKLLLDQIAIPQPAAGQVLVKIAAIGVNFIDIYFRSGLYKADLPITLGMEASGVVEAIGEGVTGLVPGDRVAYSMQRGSYAEYAVVPAWQLVKVPLAVNFQQAAAVMLQGMTAHYLTHSTFPLTSEHTALVHAAAGGTGQLVVQMAKMRGATVIATVGSAEKVALAKAAGADHVILYNEQDFAVESKALTGGKGVHVVFDSVGASTFMKGLDSLRPRGMMVTFGNASGPVPAIEPLLLNTKGALFLTRPTLFHYCQDQQEVNWRAGDVLGWIADGKLKVHIGGTYKLADAAQAHIDLASRKTTGKLLLTLD